MHDKSWMHFNSQLFFIFCKLAMWFTSTRGQQKCDTVLCSASLSLYLYGNHRNASSPSAWLTGTFSSKMCQCASYCMPSYTSIWRKRTIHVHYTAGSKPLIPQGEKLLYCQITLMHLKFILNYIYYIPHIFIKLYFFIKNDIISKTIQFKSLKRCDINFRIFSI